MNVPVQLTGFADRLSLATPGQVVVLVLPLPATASLVWLTVLLGGPVQPVLTTGVLLLAVLASLLPDSSAPLFLVLALALRWALVVPDPLSVWTLAAAGLLLVIHLAATLGSHGPPALVLAPALLALWGRRAAVMAAATALVWVGAVTLEALDLPANTLVVVIGLMLALGGTALLGRLLVTREGG